MTLKVNIQCQGAACIPVEDLTPFQGNLKDLSEESYKKLKKEILELGFSEPVSVWRHDGKNLLLNGHQRHRTLLRMKQDGVDVPPIPVNWIEAKTEKEAKKKVLALTSQYGQITGEGLYEFAIHADLTPEEIRESFRFPEINPDSWELEFFKDNEVPPGDPDEVPEHVEPRTKLGDIYQLGDHRLMCGDSTSVSDVENMMGGVRAACVFTDPPYGVAYQSNMRTKSERFDIIENDDTIITEWVNVLPVVSDGWVFVWTTWKVLAKWIEVTSPIGEMTNLVVWDKGGGGIGDLEGTFSTDHEIAMVFNRGAKITGKRVGSVWSIGKDRAADYMHPTQKPVALAEMALDNVTRRGDVVLDLFGGSGSTLIAAEKTKRKCFMMELDPKYCDVIIARWEAYTGRKAVLLTGSLQDGES